MTGLGTMLFITDYLNAPNPQQACCGGIIRDCTLAFSSVTEEHPMPTYVYEVIEENGTAGERFEVDQPMSADPLTTHPMNGKPVRRVITGFRIAGKWSDIGTQDKLSDKNLDRIGFTKYVRSGDGYYEKTAGKGPNMISGNDDS